MQRKQYLVKISNEIEGNKFIKYLEDEGFENIQANPIPQRVRLKSTSARFLKFMSYQPVRDGAPMKIKAFAILRED